jgi:Mg/Co/Ni transporter MgtE
MYDEPVAVRTDASQEEVTDVVARYNLLALPIVDAEGRLEGIVTVDDAMDTLLPQPSKRRIPRLFSRSGAAER